MVDTVAVSATANSRMQRQHLEDVAFRGATRTFALGVLLLLGAVMVSLLIGALPAMRAFGFTFLVDQTWNPVKQVFGGAPAIYGTLVTSLIAMLVGVPLALGVAVFLTELCPPFLRRPIGVLIELLAAIPSIIYGIWGLFILAPFLQLTVQPFLKAALGDIPLLGILFGGPPLGLGVLTAGFILAVMVLPYTRVGVVGGIMLGLGRALGETMAVTFVIGNAHRISPSLLAPGTTISAAIANEFTEAVGDLYTSSLIALGLLLFLITFSVIALAQAMLRRLERRTGAVA